MNLNVGNTLAVLANGTLIQSGGNISVTGLLVSGRDTYQSGNLSVSNLTLNAGSVFQATQGGAIAVASTLTIVSVCTLDGNVSVSTATTALNSGGYLTLNNASLYATSMVLTSGSTLQLNNPVTSYIQAGTITNGGDIAGAGYLNVTIFNNAGGEIDVALAQSLTIAGAGNTNSGLITLVGGTLHFTHALTNSASIKASARSAWMAVLPTTALSPSPVLRRSMAISPTTPPSICRGLNPMSSSAISPTIPVSRLTPARRPPFTELSPAMRPFLTW